MLKMALFDRAINENRLQCLRGICPLFSSPSRANRQLKSSPHLREFAIQGKKKNANTRGSARGGAGEGGWAQVELTDALWRKQNETEKRVVFFTTFQSNGLHPERLGAFLSCWEYRNHYHKRRIFQYQFQIVFISIFTFSKDLVWRN